MNIQQQVCSLELAKKLKELGENQQSHWYWCKCNNPDFGQIGEWLLIQHYSVNWNEYAAFTVAELGERMPFPVLYHEKRCFISSERTNSDDVLGEKWECGIFAMYKGTPLKYVFADTEANARAKMLIWLIENGYIFANDDSP